MHSTQVKKEYKSVTQHLADEKYRTVDLSKVQADNAFVRRFLFDSSRKDPIKQRWPILEDMQRMIKEGPDQRVSVKQFRFLRQRYELTELYDKAATGNSFLDEMRSKILDQEDEKGELTINEQTLTDKQFAVTKRILEQDKAVQSFIATNASSKSLVAWAKFKFLSLHPLVAQLYEEMVDNGGTIAEEDKELVRLFVKHVNTVQPQDGMRAYGKWITWKAKIRAPQEEFQDVLQRRREEPFVPLSQMIDVAALIEGLPAYVTKCMERKDRLCDAFQALGDATGEREDGSDAEGFLRELISEQDPIVSFLWYADDLSVQDTANRLHSRWRQKFEDPLRRRLMDFLSNPGIEEDDTSGRVKEIKKQLSLGAQPEEELLEEVDTLVETLS